jgi:hypothetical protein
VVLVDGESHQLNSLQAMAQHHAAYLHNFGTPLHQLRHPLRGGGKNGIDGQVRFIMRSVDRS